MTNNIDELVKLFDVVLVDARHNTKIWRIVCRWNGYIVPDISINSNPDRRDKAEASMKGILTNIVNNEYKGKMALSDIILEYYLLGENN